MALPEGWRSMRLMDLLPEKTIRKLVPVLNDIQKSGQHGKLAHDRVLEILEPHRVDLLAKDVLPEYLAYVLLAHIQRGGDLPSFPLN